MDEFELTYLPKRLPERLLEAPAKEMLDIYVPASIEHPYLRIRCRGDKYEITSKQPVAPGDQSHQHENTIPLTKEEYDELAVVPGKRVAKTRYLYEENGRTYEVDVFKDGLAGLVLVDVEFSSAEEKAAFTPPDWLGPEVTQKVFLAGGMLCGKRFDDIKDKLAEFNYSPISIS